MFFVNGFVVPVIWLINPIDLIKRISRNNHYGSAYLTQKEAHQLMEKPPFPMGKLYSEIIETIWFTFLYSSIIPVGGIVTLIGLSLHYFVDKITLMKRSSVTEKVSGKFIIKALGLLEFCIIMKPLG